jgi:AraC-like DNA-binding protein
MAELELLIGHVQRFAGELIDIETPDDLARAISRLVDDTPETSMPVERFVAADVLMRAVVTISAYLHEESARRSCGCESVNADAAWLLTQPLSFHPREVFMHWSQEFIATYRRYHPTTPAAAAAALIRCAPTRTWHVAELAELVGTTPRKLLRQFIDERGIGIRDYVHLLRLTRAFPALVASSDKIEVIALELGYHSKKDFYRIVRQSLRVTPAQLRRLPPTEQCRLFDELQRRHLRARRIPLPPPRRPPDALIANA